MNTWNLGQGTSTEVNGGRAVPFPTLPWIAWRAEPGVSPEYHQVWLPPPHPSKNAAIEFWRFLRTCQIFVRMFFCLLRLQVTDKERTAWREAVENWGLDTVWLSHNEWQDWEKRDTFLQACASQQLPWQGICHVLNRGKRTVRTISSPKGTWLGG